MTVYTNPQLVNLNLKLRTLPLPTEADLARAVDAAAKRYGEKALLASEADALFDIACEEQRPVQMKNQLATLATLAEIDKRIAYHEWQDAKAALLAGNKN